LHTAAYPTEALAGGGFTQEPEDWWQALLRSASAAVRGADSRQVRALVLASQIGTHLLVTTDGVPLTRAVTWQDGRSIHDQLAIEQQYTRPRIASLVGINLPSAASWPLPRLRWFEREDPVAFKKARYLFQPKEFLINRLTGAVVGDSSSWRGLVNPSTGTALLVVDGLGISDLTVPIKEPTDVAGDLRDEVADLLGVDRKTPVFVGWNDLNSSLLGAGAINDGQAFDLGGTSEHVGVVLASSPDGEFRPSAADQLVMDGPYGLEDGLPGSMRYGVSSNGGLVVAWCRSLAGPQAQAADIERLASKAVLGSNGLTFLPYIVGERAPVWDPDATGAFVGVTVRSGLPEFLRAALEGVAFNLRQIMELVGPAGANPRSPVRATGGPARMHLWNQIKADVFGRPLEVPQEPEVGILGAAMVAAAGIGWYAGLLEAARAMHTEVSQVSPDPKNSELYADLYASFLRLYPSLNR
jgi:sugar (pentulose or hexulose) kinase